MPERLSLEGLRYAQAVAETKSFSAAARAYGVTQPALSNGIAKLEERLGGKLFGRSPRGVKQTAFGARVLPLVARTWSRSTPSPPRRDASPRGEDPHGYLAADQLLLGCPRIQPGR
ncbi:LysR family transcriptional regulator [Streptomyces sp. NPDC001705]